MKKFEHNIFSAMVAAEGIRKMDAVYDNDIEMKNPDVSQIGKAVWMALQELVVLIATNFMKIIFPGFSVERVYGKIILHSNSGNDIMSIYDGQIEDGIVHREPSGIEINAKENPESLIRILPPEMSFYLLTYNEKIDINELINKQHEVIRRKRDLAKIFEDFSDLPTVQDKALWLVTSRKLEQEIETLRVFNISDKKMDFEDTNHPHRQIIDEDFVDDEDDEPYYIDLDMDRFPDIY